MTTVYWNIFDKDAIHPEHCMALSHFNPEPVLPYIVANRKVVDPNEAYISCPAFLDYYKNIYLVRSPVDIQITYTSDTNGLRIAPQDQYFYDKFIKHRGNPSVKENPFLMSFLFYYLYIADDECMVEQLPVTFHDNAVASKIRVISGTFDISKWFRPVEFSFEFLNKDEPLVIKRGDPLYYIRFVPKDNSKVRLEKKKLSEEVFNATNSCTSLKFGLPRQPFKILYELAKRVKPKLSKKCPFNWR
jgi:hypothetical protein